MAIATVNKPKAAALSLFDRLGGVPAVRAVIEEFYQRVLKDERLAFFFDGALMANLKVRIARQLASSVPCHQISSTVVLHYRITLISDQSHSLSGIARLFVAYPSLRQQLHQLRFFKIALTEIPKDMNVGALILQKHVRLFTNKGLNETHFDLVAGHLIDTMVHFEVSQDLINEAVAIVSPLRSSFEEGSKLYNRKSDSASISSATEAESEDDADDSSLTNTPSGQSSSNEGTAPAATTITLLDKLGGFSILRKIVEDMYSRIEADATVRTLLREVRDVPRFKLRQVITLKQVLEGKANVQEAMFQQNYEEFHGMHLTKGQYDRLIEHLTRCLKQHHLSHGVIDEFLAAIAEPIRGLCETPCSSSSRPSPSSFESEQVEI